MHVPHNFRLITKNDLLDILKEQLKDLNNEIFKAQLDVFKQEPHNNIEWFNIALTNMVHSNINAFLSLNASSSRSAFATFLSATHLSPAAFS